ncbi:18923_t:CDS:2, partial [Gigaspora margarita]
MPSQQRLYNNAFTTTPSQLNAFTTTPSQHVLDCELSSKSLLVERLEWGL